MRLVRSINAIMLALFCVLLFTPHGVAQLVKGSISGTVTDSSGAVIKGASVVATEVTTNYVLQTTSNSTGFYAFPVLSPGSYTIRASSEGFQTISKNDIELHTGGTLTMNFTLSVGRVEDVVTVSAATQQLLDAESPTLSQELDTLEINELPIQQRNIMSLVVFMPGVVTTKASTQIGVVGNRNYFDNNYAIDGSRTSSNEVLLDGIPDTIGDFNGIGVSPPIGSVAEYKVTSGTPSAQYGRTSGGTVNMTTRGGTNKYFGEAYGFLQNSVFNANSWYNNHNHVAKTSSASAQFGGNFSGPVWIPRLYNGRDKTFFFADYEGHRQRNPVNDLAIVPTDAMRQGDFSGTGYTIYDPATTACVDDACSSYTRSAFDNNQIPIARFDPVAANMLKYWPEPNAASSGNYYYAGVEPEHKNLYDLRIDQHFSSNHTFFARYIAETHVDKTPDYLKTGASNGRVLTDSFHNFVVGDDYTFRSTINDLRFGMTRAHARQAPYSDGFAPSNLGFPSAIDSFVTEREFPTVIMSGHSNMTTLGGQGFNNQPRETWSLADGIVKVVGNHQLRFGADLRLYRFFAFQSTAPDGYYVFTNTYTRQNPLSEDSSTGSAFASFLLGTMEPGSYIEYITRLTAFHHYFAFYGSDIWKITRNLTLNVGLRWEREDGTKESKDRLTYFDPTQDSPLNGQVYGMNLTGALNFTGGANPRAITDTPYTAFQPRVGLVYAPDNKTVLRASYGIMALPLSLEISSAQGFNITDTIPQPSYVYPSVTLSNPFPNGIEEPAGKTVGTSVNIGSAINAVLRKVSYPYNQIWTASVQRTVGRDWMIEADYIGSRGIHLPMNGISMSQLPDSYLSYGSALTQYVSNPFYGVINNGGSLSGWAVTQGQLYQAYPQYTSVNWIRPNKGDSWYDSMQVKATKRFSYGLSLQASYNWSKEFDLGGVGNASAYLDQTYIQDVHNLRGEKALSDQDVPNALLLTGVANLPFGKGGRIGSSLQGWKNTVVGGWQLSGNWMWQGGRPIALGASNTNYGFGNPMERPNVVAGVQQNYSLSTARRNAEKDGIWFNTAAFTQPASYSFGNASRTLPRLRTDTYRDVDLSMHKNFPIVEHKVTAQFRAEAFNVFNQVVFGTPDGGLADSGYGKIFGAANNPRVLQFALRLFF